MDKKCMVCGDALKRGNKFCSYRCAGLYKQHYAVCPICGTTFKKSPSDVSIKTCGNVECRKAYRAKIMTPQFAERGHEAVKASPNTGHFDTHHGAVEWQLVSPSGDLYKFKNLILWSEQHVDLLPVSLRTGKRVSARTFYREISRLKSDAEKYSCSHDNYYGWRVVKDKQN